jgi:hypothetical protein
MPVNLKTAESPPRDGVLHHVEHPSGIPRRMQECETNEPVGVPRDDSRHLRVRGGIVGAEQGKDDGPVDAGAARTVIASPLPAWQ